MPVSEASILVEVINATNLMRNNGVGGFQANMYFPR